MVTRCRWTSNYDEDSAMINYHDQEFGQPVHQEQLLFEMMTLELFQSGLSWSTIINKRAHFKAAFADFDVNKVALFDEQDEQRLLADAGIVRNRMKIEATINNAKAMVAMHEKGLQLADVVWQMTDGQTKMIGVATGEKVPASTELSKDFSKKLKKLGFKFVGPVTMQSFLEAVGVMNAHDLGCDFR